MPEGIREVQVELQRELDKAFEEILTRGGEKADKYIMAITLRKPDLAIEKYPEVQEVLKKFAQDSRFKDDPELNHAIQGEGDEATIDMFKGITGRKEDFFELDKQAMIEEMHDALETMAELAGEEGKIGVVPGNQEKSNWQRVTSEVLPQFQRDVDLQGGSLVIMR